MNTDPIYLILQRVLELNLDPNQKFKLEVAQDIMDAILLHADHNDTKYLKLNDDSYTFFMSHRNKWSPKIWVNDTFKDGQFLVTVIDIQ